HPYWRRDDVSIAGRERRSFPYFASARRGKRPTEPGGSSGRKACSSRSKHIREVDHSYPVGRNHYYVVCLSDLADFSWQELDAFDCLKKTKPHSFGFGSNWPAGNADLAGPRSSFRKRTRDPCL